MNDPYKTSKEVLSQVPAISIGSSSTSYSPPVNKPRVNTVVPPSEEEQHHRFPDFLEGSVPVSMLVKENSMWYNNSTNQLFIALAATKKMYDEFESTGTVKKYPSVHTVFKKGRKYLQWVKCDRNLHFYKEGSLTRCEERLKEGFWKVFISALGNDRY